MAFTGREREILLLDGRRALVRDVREDDADSLFRLEQATTADALLQGEDPDPEPLPVEERRFWAQSLLATPGWIALVAELEGALVATLEFRARELPRLNQHVGRFFISVVAPARGLGLGRALMEEMLAWVRTQPSVEKVSLTVLSTNEPAMRLYEALGFREEARKRREFKLPDGTYADDVGMALFVR